MAEPLSTAKIWQYPVKASQNKSDPSTLADIIDAAAEGDCIYLTPGVHTVTEPLKFTKSIFLIGFDDADNTPVELHFDGKLLMPVVPMLRADAKRVVFSKLTCTFTHNDAEASANRAAESYAIMVASGECEMQGCTLRSSVSGVLVKANAKCVLTDCDIQAFDAGVASLGTCVAENCRFRDSAVGFEAKGLECNAQIDRSTFLGCAAGVKASGPAVLTDSTVSDCTIGFSTQLDTPDQVDSIVVTGTEFVNCDRGAFIAGEGVFRKCRFERCRTSGILIEQGDPRIQGSTFNHCAVAMEVLGGRASIQACLILRCRDVGILVSGPMTMPSIVECVFTSITNDGNKMAPVAASFKTATERIVSADDALALPIDAAIAVAVEEGAAPHVEACSFSDNDVNAWFIAACGVLSGCILSNAVFDSILIAGDGSEVAVSHNQVEGSHRGAGVSVIARSKASIKKNTIHSCRLAAVCLRSALTTEVTANELKDCQDAIVVMGESFGLASRNVTNLRVVVFNDAVSTFSVRDTASA